MADDDNTEFEKLTTEGFGMLEKQLGQEAYQVNIDVGRSNVTVNNAQAETQKAYSCRINAQAELFRAITFIMFLASIPAIVWLWRWAV